MGVGDISTCRRFNRTNDTLSLINQKPKIAFDTGKKYCGEACIKQHLRLKKFKLASEENLWLGQDRRKRAMETILKLAREHCPMSYKKFACTVSYRTGLSLRKITDDYLEVLLELGLLVRKENNLNLGDEAS